MNDAEKKAARIAAEFPKRCACGRTYATRAEWGRLDFAYLYRDAFASFEARHCPCRSTLMIVVEVHDLDAE